MFYLTFFQEDIELLKKEDMNIHERLAVQLRMCEKRILKQHKLMLGSEKHLSREINLKQQLHSVKK